MAKQFDLDEFRAFVASKPAGETFNPWNGRTCAGYQFLVSRGAPVKRCGGWNWYDTDGNNHRLPGWFVDLLNWVANLPKPTFGALNDRLNALATRLDGRG